MSIFSRRKTATMDDLAALEARIAGHLANAGAAPARTDIPDAWRGQDFASLAEEIAKPEYEGLSDAAIVQKLMKIMVTVPYVQAIGFNPNNFHEGMVIHARRGGGL